MTFCYHSGICTLVLRMEIRIYSVAPFRGHVVPVFCPFDCENIHYHLHMLWLLGWYVKREIFYVDLPLDVGRRLELCFYILYLKFKFKILSLSLELVPVFISCWSTYLGSHVYYLNSFWGSFCSDFWTALASSEEQVSFSVNWSSTPFLFSYLLLLWRTWCF